MWYLWYPSGHVETVNHSNVYFAGKMNFIISLMDSTYCNDKDNWPCQSQNSWWHKMARYQGVLIWAPRHPHFILTILTFKPLSHPLESSNGLSWSGYRSLPVPHNDNSMIKQLASLPISRLPASLTGLHVWKITLRFLWKNLLAKKEIWII